MSVKISLLTNVVNYNPIYKNNSNINKSRVGNNSNYNFNGDVVSFSAKKYEAEDIANKTMHCAYCGSKVYNEQQIDGLAKELLASKADKLEGKVKSILEKMELAKHSPDLALAKKMENESNIKFFNKFLEDAQNKAWLKGEAIFEQVYDMDKESALETIKENLKPLQRTIDHVSPQNLAQDNMNSDINLVEACYTCNHDIKQGLSFNEFYNMFPSIQRNMPSEKFKYAHAKLLDSSQSDITFRLSATNLLKHLGLLFTQKKDVQNEINSLDFRIETCKSQINSAIDSCQKDINEKKQQVQDLESKLSELKQDDEFNAIVKRNSLEDNISNIDSVIENLRGKRTRASNSINEIRNQDKKKQKDDKRKVILSPEEKKEKIESLKAAISVYNTQISEKEEERLGIQVELEQLNMKYPTIQMLQQSKSKADSIIFAHSSLKNLRSDIETARANYSDYVAQEKQLTDDMALCADKKDFNPDKYSEEDKQKYNEFLALSEALEYINSHPNGGSLRVTINNAAKTEIERNLSELNKSDIVIDYLKSVEYKTLNSNLEKTKKAKQETENEIKSLETQIQSYEKRTEGVSFEDASQESLKCAEDIRRLTDKENQVKIPSIIQKINAEITLLEYTIKDLLDKQNQN